MTQTDPPPAPEPLPLPWRSALLGWLVAAAALIVGVPMFLRMPPWCDLTLYDIAARNILAGGVHYRDVFDTNPPGFVLCLVAIRTLFGTSVEAVRAVDLSVVAATIALLCGWVRVAGGSRAAVAWMVAGVAVFYPFISEFNHCQRDVWMMLPVIVAARLRLRRIEAGGGRLVGGALLEGLILGAAAWMKPHCLFPAAAVWMVTLPRLALGGPRPGARAMLDFLANFAGGLIALGLGLGWIVGSGAWPAFVEVFTFWNPGYLSMVIGEFYARWPYEFLYFTPWSLFLPFAGALSVKSLWFERWWRPDVNGADLSRTALSALFLVWAAQAVFLQRGFDYVHVPETFLSLAVLAAAGYPTGFVGVTATAAFFVLIQVGAVSDGVKSVIGPFLRTYDQLFKAVTPIAATRTDRFRQWPECWRTGLTGEEFARRRNVLGYQIDVFPGINWVEIGQVAEFLASQNPPVRDGDVIAWHDSPHAIYLVAGLRPSFRFMHVGTASQIGEKQYRRVRDELHAAAKTARYVVADLERVFPGGGQRIREMKEQPGPTPEDLVPSVLRENYPRLSAQFPFDLPSVFRSNGGRGRYVVFRIDRPITKECRIPSELGIDLPPED